MGEVKALETRKDRVQSAVVQVLEEVLERAKEGDFQGLTVAAVMVDGSSFTVSSESWCLPAMIGALSVAQHRLLEARQASD